MKISKRLGAIGYLKLYCRKGLSKICLQDLAAEFFETTITQPQLDFFSAT
jgi:hypothetical protein